MTDPRLHNYYAKLLQLFDEGKLSPGRLTEVFIYHDDWCGIYQGGYCDCDPEIELQPPPEQD
jgi:hypothetical protein